MTNKILYGGIDYSDDSAKYMLSLFPTFYIINDSSTGFDVKLNDVTLTCNFEEVHEWLLENQHQLQNRIFIGKTVKTYQLLKNNNSSYNFNVIYIKFEDKNDAALFKMALL